MIAEIVVYGYNSKTIVELYRVVPGFFERREGSLGQPATPNVSNVLVEPMTGHIFTLNMGWGKPKEGKEI